MLEDYPLDVELPLAVEEPSINPETIQVETPYGLSEQEDGEISLSERLTISINGNESSARLYAVIRGRLRFISSTSTEPARLELQPLPLEQVALSERLRGSPTVNRMVYGNVEPSSVEEAAHLLLTSAGVSSSSVEEQINEFMNSERWITASAGSYIGRAALDPSVNDRHQINLLIIGDDDFYFNPFYYFSRFQIINESIRENNFIQAIDSDQNRILFPTKNREIFVSKHSPNPQPPYDANETAAHRINDAMAEAKTGDTVIVLDDEIYKENVTITDGIGLTSKYLINQSILPTLDGQRYPPKPGISIKESKNTHISGFIVTRSEAGGIVVKYSRNVDISANTIRDNVIHEQGGGGVLIQGSKNVTISGNEIHDNQAITRVTTGTNWGGGIFISSIDYYNNNITIERNNIYRNSSGFGGGIAVSGSNSNAVKIIENIIGGNSPEEAAQRSNRVNQDRLSYQYSTVMHLPTGGGGGIGLYRTPVNTLIKGNEITNNEAHVGGGIEFYNDAGGKVIENAISKNNTRKAVDHGYPTGELGGDGGGIAVNRISTNREHAISYQRPVILLNNKIDNNYAKDDGGGVYGTGNILLVIEGKKQVIKENSAWNNGGGIRVSFGSMIRIDEGVVTNNRANLNPNPDPNKRISGGGGIAIRNSDIRIERCEITENTVDDFGGGGVYILTADIGSLFGAILENEFGFEQGQVYLGTSSIINNNATDKRGAGGGVYAVYGKYNLLIRVNETVLSPNSANHAESDKRYNIVIENRKSHEIVNEARDQKLASLKPLVRYERLFTS